MGLSMDHAEWRIRTNLSKTKVCQLPTHVHVSTVTQAGYSDVMVDMIDVHVHLYGAQQRCMLLCPGNVLDICHKVFAK